MVTGSMYAICPSGCVVGDPVQYTVGTGIIDAGPSLTVPTAVLDGAYWDTNTVAGGIGIIIVPNHTATDNP